jgi:hypothetical protein
MGTRRSIVAGARRERVRNRGEQSAAALDQCPRPFERLLRLRPSQVGFGLTIVVQFDAHFTLIKQSDRHASGGRAGRVRA